MKAVEIYESEGGTINDSTATPYLDSLAVDDGTPEGKMKASAASHLMRPLYAARVARPDLITSVTRLAHHVSKWKMQHDVALRRIFSYIKGTTDLVLTGTLSVDDSSDFEIHVYPDADLGGDHSSSKSTSGLWIEATSRDGTRSWPLTWSSKRQSCTSSSTCEAEMLSLSPAVRKEGLPLQSLLSEIMGRDVTLITWEDNTQAISAIRRGYSTTSFEAYPPAGPGSVARDLLRHA